MNEKVLIYIFYWKISFLFYFPKYFNWPCYSLQNNVINKKKPFCKPSEAETDSFWKIIPIPRPPPPLCHFTHVCLLFNLNRFKCFYNTSKSSKILFELFSLFSARKSRSKCVGPTTARFSFCRKFAPTKQNWSVQNCTIQVL